VVPVLDYRPIIGRGNTLVLAFGTLEWSFLAALVVLVGAAGVFFLFILLQLFRAHSRR
jgi:hypothetical protein